MLRELVEGLPRDWKPREAAYPAISRLAEVERRITAEQPEREPPALELPTVALARLRDRLVECWVSGAWTALSPRDWRHANDCLALGEPRLIDDAAFVAAYLAALNRHRSTTASANLLARWYVRNFEPDHDGIRSIGAYLASGPGRLRAIWTTLHRRYRLFDSGQTLAVLAAAFTATEAPPTTMIRSLRVPPSVLSSRLFGHVFVAVCRVIAGGAPPSLAWIEDLCRWAFGTSGVFQHNAIPDAQAAYAEAMLRPWFRRFPGEPIRALIVGHLLELMMDPRTNPTGWAGVSEEARWVMLGWMIKDALEQFLEVVDETIQSHQSRMWAERRQFWLFHYDQQHIHECWVVFGRRGAALARHIAAQKNNPSLGTFGCFVRDVGGDPNQAVLLMRVGRLLIADWSHNGRCYIWLPGNANQPHLYQTEYIREDLLTGADFETPHHRNWQSLVNDFIATHTSAGFLSA